ncbi:MAG: hypothetical protein ABIH41_01665 [Nanoarchaeota archaeon]
MEAKVTSAQRHKLKHFIKDLERVQGRHTELVSVYVPAGYDLNKIIAHISQEQGTASNIKSKSTRDNVIAALERMIRHLRLYPRTPPHGLAAFSGNVSEREGQPDYQIFSVEPPVPLNQRLYRCDKEFVLEPLREICDDKTVYGLVVMDKREGNVAILKGKTIIPLSNATSAVPGKTRAGGQCMPPGTLVALADGKTTRLENIQLGDELLGIDLKTKKTIITACTDAWKTHKETLITIQAGERIVRCSQDHIIFLVRKRKVVEIPASEVVKHDTVLVQDNKKVVGRKVSEIEVEEGIYPMLDISTEAGNFIAEGILVHNSAQRFERLRDGAAKDFMKRIAEMMKEAFLERHELKGIIVGGPGHTKNEFVDTNYITDQLKRKIIGIKDLSYTGEFGLQELLEKSEDILSEEEVMQEKVIMQKFFDRLAKQPGAASYGKAEVMKQLKAGTVDIVLLSETLDDKLIEEYEAEALKMGSSVVIVSTDTREGVQLRDLGAVAAILRFEVNS